jgi:predicted kinase
MKKIDQHTIVLMIGPSGSGKSTLAEQLFPAHEVVSSDSIRAELCGDFRIQTRNDDVFAELHRRVEHRIYMGQRVVVDATNLKSRDRRFFIDLARRYGVKLYYIVVNRPISEKLKSGGWRLEVNGLIQKHDATFQSNLKDILKGDGVAEVIQMDDEICVVRRGTVDEMIYRGGFDRVMAVGDIHGNITEARAAAAIADDTNAFTIYLGDVIDYGDHNLDAFWFVYKRVMQGKALMVWGNHERKLDMWIRNGFGANYRGQIGHGMQKTVDEIHKLKDRRAFAAAWQAMECLSRQHYVWGNRLFTHAAATPTLWNNRDHRPHGVDGQLAYFGQVDKDTPFREDGYPNRVYDWVNTVPTGKTVVVGHDIRSKDQPMVIENDMGGTAIFLDTGSGKGGKLSHIMFEFEIKQ